MPRPPHPAPHPAGEHDATSTALAKLLRETPYEHISFPAARVVPRTEAQSILALAARVGRALFRAGAETQHIEAAVLAVAAAQGMREVTADINARIITLQYVSQGYDPLALMEVIGSEETRNLRHLAQLDISAGHHTPDQARQALDRAENSPAPSWWQSQAGGALLSSMLCLLAAGTLRAALIPPVLFLVAAAVERALAATRLAGFFVTAARVAVLVALVTALVGLGIYSHSEAASTLAGNLILVLPLFTIVSLTEDKISGYRAVAAARAISLLSFFTALATGFALVAFMLRNTESDARSTTLLALPVAVSLLTGAVGALGNTFYMGGTWRFVPPACALDSQLPVFLATGLATWAMGFAAAHLARRTPHSSGRRELACSIHCLVVHTECLSRTAAHDHPQRLQQHAFNLSSQAPTPCGPEDIPRNRRRTDALLPGIHPRQARSGSSFNLNTDIPGPRPRHHQVFITVKVLEPTDSPFPPSTVAAIGVLPAQEVTPVRQIPAVLQPGQRSRNVAGTRGDLRTCRWEAAIPVLPGLDRPEVGVRPGPLRGLSRLRSNRLSLSSLTRGNSRSALKSLSDGPS
ncbi:threonine/serine exporter family protein [Streptomyces sp. AS13]|uniref:threonine/serine exporter family protein n=1 Tax=Streptomyces sp. AS13 TaxID=3038080 RepID=UPI00278BBE86|nr:threonine/serine exporter family protein [Streptomyces sp. AS13]